MKLMILDGNSIVNRAFYGVRPLSAPDGTPTNAVYGFLAILQRMLDEQKPEAVCVSFDLKAPTFRHKACNFYKAQRKPMPEELAVQMPLLKETLDAMGIRRYEIEGFEADDILGTAARRVRKKRMGLCGRHRRQGQLAARERDDVGLQRENRQGPDGDDTLYSRKLPRGILLCPGADGRPESADGGQLGQYSGCTRHW